MQVAHRGVGGAQAAAFFSLRGLAQGVTKLVLKFFYALPSRKTEPRKRQKRHVDSITYRSFVFTVFSYFLRCFGHRATTHKRGECRPTEPIDEPAAPS
ncbi:MAG: hypothetical protein OEY03_15390, partial [Rhizobacter sp.]|nr:hypothetical protein [Rhizobacter sp.]